jgi:hypothetical protein
MGELTVRRRAPERLGGPAGNEILTSAVAASLTLLLAAEGVTIPLLGSLRVEHMFIGMLLVPPVLLKLGSTGYRFVRYYARSRPYREKGPPALALRLLAPVLVAATILVFATGIVLLVNGRRPAAVLELHKIGFIVWGACFAVHFLSYLPRMARSLAVDVSAVGSRTVPGRGIRLSLVLASVGAGLALALALLSMIHAWQPGQQG